MKRIILPILLFVFQIGFSQSFDIYVSDAGNFNNGPWQILKYDANGGNPQRVTNSNLGWPQDILFLEDSNLMLVSNLTTNNITKYNATTGAYLGVFASGISGTTRMKIGPDSALYVLQWSGNGRVKRFDLVGNFLGDFTTVGVSQAIGLDWDSSGNLYVSSYNGDHVRKFDTSGTDMGLFISANLAGPTNIWFNAAGELMVSDYDGGAIKRFSSAGTYLGIFAMGLSQSEGIEFLPNGHLIIGNGGNGSVREYDSTGTYIGNIVAPSAGGLIRPNALRIRMNTSTGIIEKKLPSEFNFNLLNNQLEVAGNDGFSVKCLDLQGRTVVEQECSSYCSISLPSMERGVYLLQFVSGERLRESHKLFYSGK